MYQISSEKPTKICPYGENCYRKNPIHFGEFWHPHLGNILLKGLDKHTKEYDIPDDLFLTKDVVQAQLKILVKLFPDLQIEHKETSEEKPIPSGNASGSKVESQSQGEQTFQSTKTPEPSTLRVEKRAQVRQRSPTPGSSTSADGSRLSKKPKLTKNINEYIKVVLPKGQMAKKLEKAAPYNFFLTAITDSKPTHEEPLTITLQEILDESLGEIESSVQINFMVDIGWLLGHYYFAGCLDNPLLVLYGDETPEMRTISKHKPQVEAIKVHMSSPFATHHTKMMLFGYKDGSITQGLWISPKLEALPEERNTDAGESPTGFKNDLMLYLVEYKIAKLQPWIARIRNSDFSSVNVFFVASVPGGFRNTARGFSWGHARLGGLLNKHSARIDENCPIVAQSSSIGSLGNSVQAWVMTDFVNSLRKDSAPIGLRRLPQFKMIYPSYANVMSSHDGILGGGCLPYGKKVNDKQTWLKDHLHQWKAKGRHRSRAMPHIKSYCRWSDAGLYWFMLSSANLSKAAWGGFNKNVKIEPTLRIMNYEVGVLFLPRFVIGEDTFPLEKERDGIPAFPVPYDIPLIPYGGDDVPFVMDYLTAMGY